MTLKDLHKCESLTVDVTQEDIDHGSVESLSSCAIALAINRTLEAIPDTTIVGSTCVSVRVPNNENPLSWRDYSFVRFSHTPESLEFIRKFDEEQEVKPISIKFRRTW